MADGVALSDMPKTYRDVISFSAKLGIRYVWIDSLCIIQDDISDWQRESAAMWVIFQNSYLTIAAISSVNCEGGFLTHNPPKRVSVRGSTATGKPFWVVAAEKGSRPWHFVHPSVHNRRVYSDGSTTAGAEWPLLTRGWVLQEQVLAPRVIYFTKREMIWECGSETLCECGLTPLILSSALRGFGGVSDSYLQGSKALWHTIVEEYSRRHLTFSSDKFPAVSGMAKRVAAMRSGARYLAGLWEDSLIADLLWTLRKQETHIGATQDTHTNGRTPSWSWASRDGHITFPSDLCARELEEGSTLEGWIEILDIDCEPSTLDRTGTVKAGRSVSLTGCGIEVNISRACINPIAGRCPAQVQFSVTGLPFSRSDYGGISRPQITNVYVDDPISFKEGDEVSKNLDCLRITFVAMRRGDLGPKTVEYFMLLRPVDAPEAGMDEKGIPCYQRVGIVERIWAGERSWSSWMADPAWVFQGSQEMVVRIV